MRNIGGKIKVLAYFLLFTGIIASLIFSLIIFTGTTKILMISSISGSAPMQGVVPAVIVLLFGIITSFVFGMIVYGIGEIIECLQDIRWYTEQTYEQIKKESNSSN